MTRQLLVAGIEFIAALALVALGVWCWNLGLVTTYFDSPVAGTPGYWDTHYSGAWITGTFVALTVAGLVVLDAARRVVAGRSPAAVGAGAAEHGGVE
ncbi:hypothetical protein [Skermania sp. ID1734]|uniref:hypothetical protein n=1 Tax=Skermania sp. ID1734 TaxID=2597516 RepID=UPI00163D8071|nr:hypothetical protein [Skermania sp. ID1734]